MYWRPGSSWRLRTLSLALSLAGALTPALGQAPALTGSGSRERLLPLEVTVNASPGGSWAFLERDGALYAPVDAYDEWRLRPPADANAVAFRGQQWYPLALVPGYQSKVDTSTQTIQLSFSPEAFTGTHVEPAGVTDGSEVVRAIPALHLTFDTTLDLRRLKGASTAQSAGALLEVGYSSEVGSLTSSFVARDIASSEPNQRAQLRRLETTFTRNFVDQRLTLRVGDTVTRSSVLGRLFYFGGMQLTRNFGLTPSFITQPVPVISGTSAAPSTVELYVNDVLRQTSRVPTGPFVVENLAAVSTPGEARLVVRDVLGRETVIYQPFFTDYRLLDIGITDWGLDLGAPREALGAADNTYGSPFGAGVYRTGLTKTLTIEAKTELSREAQNVGLAAVFALPLQSVGIAGVAYSSDDDRGTGRRSLLAVEHRRRLYSLSMRAEASSPNYVDIGSRSPTFRPSRSEVSAAASYNFERSGAATVALSRIAAASGATISTATLGYSMPIGSRGQLNLNVARVFGTQAATAVNVAFVLPLDQGLTYSAVTATNAGARDVYASATRNLTHETGYGWRVLGGTRGGEALSEGGLYYQNHQLLLTADASTSRNQQALRAGAQGALVLMDGSLFATRRLSSSYAMVEVPGYAGVGVGLHGVPTARTDSKGRALVSGLLPYQPNSIRLDPTELPISAEIDNIEKVVTPPDRSGVRVLFPVRSGRAALVKILLDDGDAAPAGAEVRLGSDKDIFYVARRGEAFITGLQPSNELTLSWKGRSCRLLAQLPQDSVEDIGRIGPLTCTGVPR